MTEPVDVLIIGAGASGAAVAWSLAETRMRILCLEQGDWVKPTDYPTNGRDWEARQLTDFHCSPNVRRSVSDYPINDEDSPIKVANFNGVGGGTILFAGHFPRLHPSDFRVRSLDGVAEDWPIDYAALEPYYAQNDRIMGIASLAGDPAYPPKPAVLPPIPLGRTGEVLGRAFNELGWHWWPSDSAIATQDYDGRAKCINLGHCIAGCAQGAKASTDLTYWPQALRARVGLRTRCRVREITVNAAGMASGAVYYDQNGVEQFQPAEIVIIAGNGIGTPRLLLNSKSALFPDGLANSSGLVGKNLMFHPYATVQAYFDEPLDGYRGPHISIWSQEFYETDSTRGFVRGYTFQCNRGSGPVMNAHTGMRMGKIPWGVGHQAAAQRIFGRLSSLAVICEDLPEECNTVTLDPLLKDANGIPAPKINYRLGENSRRMGEHAIARATEMYRAAGAWNVHAEFPMRWAGWHLLGTARMGRDPERSVVNEWGRSHDVKNLFIVDGSVFVTSGGVNPTSTIQAIALYIADNIKKRLANLFD
ncbi:MAG: GMC family oxidoreductase [Lysobacterales bacterium]|nr:MAG: GMC family oxidoreductase [Xanthomonadales bacterium]